MDLQKSKSMFGFGNNTSRSMRDNMHAKSNNSLEDNHHIEMTTVGQTAGSPTLDLLDKNTNSKKRNNI